MIASIVRSGGNHGRGRVEVTSETSGELMVQGDADRLKQVLLNLVDKRDQTYP